MAFFVDQTSVVREVWGKADTILFIFAGASAEFALSKAADWLFFTGRLPADPLGRLFSTVYYARQIVFSEKEAALATIDKMSAIHGQVEKARGKSIPDWAYRGVLFMLIDYSIRSFELLERKLVEEEKAEIFYTFYRVGKRMDIPGLPASFSEWLIMRTEQLQSDMKKSDYTVQLFAQYKKHLGPVRYKVLLEAQGLVAPGKVRELLNFRNTSLLKPVVPLYKVLCFLRMEWLIKSLLLPKEYHAQVRELDVNVAVF